MPETRPPSPARLRRALAAGDTPLSPFAGRVASIVTAAALLPALAKAMSARFTEALRAAVSTPEKVDAASLATDVAWLVAPLVAAAGAAAFVVGFVQTGLAVARPAAAPLRSRLFDAFRAVDAARTLLFAAIALSGVWYALAGIFPALAAHIGRSDALLADSGNAAGRIAWTSIMVAVALAAADVALRRAAWLHRLAPSPEEQRRERREAEGAPELRRARRRAHEELARLD
ncbi:MAG TPA: EscU/YscU/HrcU family type III secretion system export apparatus switch protein [Polyangiaceae bacterium]|nr:EscU/YscU/HrcU family type III secretion system export apparatus switch protein [Polyangiaceae bacterium]